MKIDFGFNNDARLNAQWSSVEQVDCEYVGAVNCNGYDLLLAIVDENQEKPEGRIAVKEVVQDYYPDGSFITYGNLEKNRVCRKAEELFNTEAIRKKLADGVSPVSILREAGMPVRTSKLHFEDKPGFAEIVTSVRPELFNGLKESQKDHRSMYARELEIRRLEEMVRELTKASKLEQQLGSSPVIGGVRR